MKRLLLLVAALVLVAASCDTKNVGVGLPTRGPMPTATFTADDTWNEGLTATLTVNWVGGSGPYTIGCNMGGGTTADVPAGTPATSPFTQVFTLVEGTWTYTVTVTDSLGMFGTATGTYTVGEPLNQPPAIDSATYDSGVLTVEVSDPDDGATLTVEVTVPAGLAVDAESKVASQTTGSTTFNWSATDIIAGGSGTTTVTVMDEFDASDSTDVAIDVGGITVPAGALVAVPTATASTVGGEVTVVVISGEFTAGPFNFMDGVGLTVGDGAGYVANSFNVGAPGGDADAGDGLWADMSPAPSGFIMPPDFMITPQATATAGLNRIDFNVTPIGGGNMTDGGALFNFGMDFSAAGTYTLGFQLFEDVRRTYYSDAASDTYEWPDISNDHAGIPNSITVN